MKIIPIGKLTGHVGQYMMIVDTVELEDLHMCVKHACRLLAYHTVDDHEREKMVAFFKDLPHTRNRRALEGAFDREYERVVT